jgi:uncharacterized membrane protein YgdD (TMEM256/DUF423 family)
MYWGRLMINSGALDMKFSRFTLVFIIFGALAALLSVAAAAFAAHGAASLAPMGARAAGWFEKAAAFQMDHALGLILMVLAAELLHTGLGAILMRAGAVLLAVAIVLFSGSLYWASFGGSSALAPVGGFAAMGGWVVFAAGAATLLWRKHKQL